MFIPTPIEYFIVKFGQQNGSGSSYCNEFYVLEVSLIFLRFEQGGGGLDHLKLAHWKRQRRSFQLGLQTKLETWMSWE